jgi:UDP-N-acetylmuramate dehydrogenase
MDELVAKLRSVADNWVTLDAAMSEQTSFGIGGKADVFVEPGTVAGLAACVRVAHEAGVQPVFIGAGTNVLVRDGGIRGVVIKVGPRLARVTVDGTHITAEAGARLATLCRESVSHGLSGLEFAAGIPGCVGGAVIMNAGAHGGEMGNVVSWVRVVQSDGSLRLLKRDELTFGYRASSLQGSGLCIAEAGFGLLRADPEQIHLALCETIERRCMKQPVSHSSAGSVFKRPDGDYAGRLVEEAGAKGMRVGGASISEKHANFIITEKAARAADVLALIEEVRSRVHKQSGIWLQPEVHVIGDDEELEGG